MGSTAENVEHVTVTNEQELKDVIVRSMAALLRVLSEWRSEFEVQMQKAKRENVNLDE
jgi:hypothetical protein